MKKNILLVSLCLCLLQACTYYKPIIGYASGYCLAGGFELLLSCDFLIVDENTKIGLPETTLGLIPAGGGISRISEALSRSLSLEILINSKNVDLEKLLYSGIINEIVNRNNVEDVIENYSKKVTGIFLRKTCLMKLKKKTEKFLWQQFIIL